MRTIRKLFSRNRVAEGNSQKKYVSIEDVPKEDVDEPGQDLTHTSKKDSVKMKKYSQVAPAPENPEKTPLSLPEAESLVEGEVGDSEEETKNISQKRLKTRFWVVLGQILKRFVTFLFNQVTDKTMLGSKMWTFVVILVTSYNVLFIPFRICFLRQHDWWWVAIDIPTDVILWMDIVVGFLTNFDADTDKLQDRKKTALNYLNPRKGWFFWDLAASLPFNYFGFIWPQYFPYLRFNRLLRLRRTLWYFAGIEESFSGVNPSLIRLTKFIFLIFVIAHLFSCVFYLIANLEGEASARWTMNVSILDPDADYLLKYWSSMYWVIVMMTGYGGTMPLSDAEVIFSLITVLVGLSVNVTILGTVGSLVANYDTNQTTFKERLDAITDYIKYRGIKGRLRKRIDKYYDYLWKSRKGLDETKLLEDLPDFLRIEVSLILNSDIVKKVDLFQGAEKTFTNEVVMHLKPFIAMAGSYIIRMGETGREMFFISRGTVEVVIKGGIIVASLGEGSSFGEVALVYDRKRNASIRAKTNCDLFVLTKDDFVEIMEAYPDEAKKVRAIAEKRFN